MSLKAAVIDSDNVALYDAMRATRNEIVHGAAINVPADVIREYIASLERLLIIVEDRDYIDHLVGLSEQGRRDALEEKLDEEKHWLVEEDAFSSAMAETNASEWEIDDISIEQVELDLESCMVRFAYSATGQQDEDRMYCGTSISGEGTAFLNRQGEVRFEDVSAGVVDDDGEVDDNDAP